MKNKTILLSALTATLLAARSSACDFCACELPLITLERQKGWHVGVSEQFTHFGTLNADGDSISNPAGQCLDSSITQIFFGYNMSRALGVQFNVPMIYRSYQRVEQGAIETGDVSGFGDVSFILHWTPLRMERGDFLITGRVFGGIKFPTGDSDRVLEEAAEGGHHEEGEGHEEGGGAIASGVHGHDLALGTGSVDGVFGADIHAQWKRAFVEAGIDVTARGPGRNDYDFADEVNWHASVGAVAVDRKDFTLACALEFSGGSKGEDVFRGMRGTDTASSIVFMGPKVIANWRQRFHVDVGIEFPISTENSGVQVVPDFRFQASAGFQF